MGIAALIATLTPTLLQAFHDWTKENPGATDDEAKAEVERLVESDATARASYLALKDAMAAAKARLTAEGEVNR